MFLAEEPDWQEVVTELLLSMLSQGNHLSRAVVNTVFSRLCPHMTAGSVQLVIDVSTCVAHQATI